MRLAAQRYRFLAGACALPGLLFAGAFSSASLAQDKAERGLPVPPGTQIAFQWSYACPKGKSCAFECSGTGRPTIHATKLTVYLGSVRGGANQEHIALFYAYSTVEVPQGNGFAINTGLGMLSCEVNGMKLDYSGPPKPTS
jgi:hypothetical protein